jgi:ABC-type lipoprotein release transport system permease subunit
LPINFRQALSNVVQKKGRLALTIVTLTLAVSAFMGVYAVFDNLNKVLGGIYDAYGFEIQVTPAQLQNFDQIKALLQSNVSGIQDVYPAVGLSIPVEGYKDTQLGTNQLGVLGIDPRTDAFKLNLQAGTAWKDNPERPGIVITSSVADKLKKKLGDKLVVLFGGKKTELEIIGIDRFAFDQAFMEWHALARLGSIGLNAPIPNRYTLPVQVAGYSGSMPGGQVIVVGFDTQVGAFLTFASGSLFIPGQAGIIISQDMAAKGGYRVGDRLNLSVGSNTKDYPITGIFSLPPQMTAQGSPSEIAGMYWEDLAALEGRSLAGEPAPNTLLVRLTNSNATVAQVDEVVKAISKLLVDHGITATFVNQVEQAQQTAQQVLSMGVIFNMTALVMAAVGAIGLLSSLSMSVFERQKEIGVMRSIGAGSGTIAGQFLVEGILVGIIAWLVGVPLSYLFGQGLMKALPFGSFIKFTYSPSGLLIGLIGMIVIATISSLWPSINAARKTVSDILRYQ